MLAYMKRTTIKVDESLDARMRNEAARLGMTVSEWTRQAIAAHLPGGEQEEDATVRRVFHSAGAGDSGRSDIAERMEELLAGLAAGHDILTEEERPPHRRMSA